MVKRSHESNLLFQSKKHPLVSLDFETTQDYCLHLIHTKAYFRAAELAANRVLDVGCNNGYGTKILSTRCQRVVGVDVSENDTPCDLTNALASGSLPDNPAEFNAILQNGPDDAVRRVL